MFPAAAGSRLRRDKLLRIKRFSISYELFSHMFMEGEHPSYFVDKGIPENSHLVGAEIAENVIELLYAHPSFPEVLTDVHPFRGPLNLFGIAPPLNVEVKTKE